MNEIHRHIFVDLELGIAACAFVQDVDDGRTLTIIHVPHHGFGLFPIDAIQNNAELRRISKACPPAGWLIEVLRAAGLIGKAQGGVGRGLVQFFEQGSGELLRSIHFGDDQSCAESKPKPKRKKKTP